MNKSRRQRRPYQGVQMIDQVNSQSQVALNAGAAFVKRRFTWFGAAAVAAAFIGALAFSPQEAEAQNCTATSSAGTTTFICQNGPINTDDTTTTVPTTATVTDTPNPIERWWQFENNNVVTAPDFTQTVNGFGLKLQVTTTGPSLSFDNETGSVAGGGGISSSGAGSSALYLTTLGGAVHYTGTGDLDCTGNCDQVGLRIWSDGGPVFVGTSSTLVTGNITGSEQAVDIETTQGIDTTGSTVFSAGGAVTYYSDAVLTSTGAASGINGDGLYVNSGVGTQNITQGGSITATNTGIDLTSTSGSITLTFQDDAPSFIIAPNSDAIAMSSGGATVSATSTASGTAESFTVNGNTVHFAIQAGDDGFDISSTGTGATATTVTNSSNIAAGETGISVSSTSDNGAASVVVTNSGSIYSADGGISVTGDGATVTVTNQGTGTFIRTSDSDGISVSTGGDITVTSTATGGSAFTSGTGTNAITYGIYAPDGHGILADETDTGTGTVTVTNSTSIYSLNSAIRADGDGGDVNVTNNAGDVLTSVIGDGIHATNFEGNVTVSNAGNIDPGGDGIKIFDTGCFYGLNCTDPATISVNGYNTGGIGISPSGVVTPVGHDGIFAGAFGFTPSATYGQVTITVVNAGVTDTEGSTSGEIFATDNGIHTWQGFDQGGSTVIYNGCDSTTLCGEAGLTSTSSSTGYIGYNPATDTLPSINFDSYTFTAGNFVTPVGGEGIRAIQDFSNGPMTVVNTDGSVIVSEGTGIRVADTVFVGPLGAIATLGDISVYNGGTQGEDGLGGVIYSIAGNGISVFSGGGYEEGPIFHHLGGNVQVANNGFVYGYEDGVKVTTFHGGNIVVTNGCNPGTYSSTPAAGTSSCGVGNAVPATGESNALSSAVNTGAVIIADTGDGIYVNDKHAFFTFDDANTGSIEVDNYGTVIAPEDHAIDIHNSGYGATTVYNDGLVIGQGFEHAVIDLHTNPGAEETENPLTDGYAVIVNGPDGTIASIDYLDHLQARAAGNYSLSASDLAFASSDYLLDVHGGDVALYNYGSMFGEMNLRTEDGNEIYNYGFWGTTGTSDFFGGTDDYLYNGGFIKAAFSPYADNYTGSLGANGKYTYYTDWDGVDSVENAGIISMVNHNAGDEFQMSGEDFTYQGDKGSLGVDVYLTGLAAGTSWKDMCGTAKSACSDLFVMNFEDSGNAPTGKTYIYVDNTNNNGGGLVPMGNGTGGIPVVHLDGVSYTGSNDINGMPNSALVADGVFKLSSNSPGYTNAFGQGAIEDGMFLYLLGERAGILSPDSTDIVLYSVPGVQAYQMASLMTAQQNIWQVTAQTYFNRETDLRDAWTCDGGPMTCNTKFGVWATGVGNWTSRNPGTVTEGDPVTFDTAYSQDTYAVLAGFDAGTSFTPDSALMFGVLGGYITSSLNYNDGGMGGHSSASFDGGSVGGYATYVNSGFFLDGLVKADLLDAKFSSPGLSSVSSGATAIGVTADGGYRFILGVLPGWNVFAEPVITGQYLHTEIGSMAPAGGTAVGFNSNGSFYGAIGGRLGATLYTTPDWAVQGSVLGRVWDDFGSNNQIVLTSGGGGGTVVLNDPFSKVWGEVVGKLDISSPSSSVNGFVSGGVDFNGQFTSITGKVGVRMNF
jgi:hypothetical protein